MSQTLRMSTLVQLVDATSGAQETLYKRPIVEKTRTTTLKACADMAVTTTEAAIPLGGVTSEGHAIIWNEETDETSNIYISVGFTEAATFYEAFRLGPNDDAKVPLSPSRTWQAKTNSSTASLRGYILQRNA
jgi:hypothetical protein